VPNGGRAAGSARRASARRLAAAAGRLYTPRMTHDRRTLVDLSHTIEHGMITYRGLPAPIVCDFLSRERSRAHYAPGTEFQIGWIGMAANTGTYVDSPFHRFADGDDLAALRLESLAELDAVVARLVDRPTRAIDRAALVDALGGPLGGASPRGRAVLVHTGWSARWRTDAYFEGHPFLAADAAEWLAAEGPALVGIDSYNIDDTDDGRRPAHTALLGAGVPIVEHLCALDRLPASGFTFSAVPVKVRGMGTFPVRAYAALP
jgi:arylformamidase